MTLPRLAVAVTALTTLFLIFQLIPRSSVGTENQRAIQQISENIAQSQPPAEAEPAIPQEQPKQEKPAEPALQKATFGAGCFWCVEAVFEQLEGVKSVTSGYSGGHVENPTYEEVCAKKTGHAEVAVIEYDPEKISFEKLLEVFWTSHDPTTKDRQGADVGPQYRSVIFYHNDQQKELAERFKKELNEANAFGVPVVTEIGPLKNFYPAENYHQGYFDLNPTNRYCQFVVAPKVEKVRKLFKDQLKK